MINTDSWTQHLLPFAPWLVAFVVAATVNGIELITSAYPGYYWLLRRSTNLFLYCLCYGFLAIIIFASVQYIHEERMLRFYGMGSNALFRGVIVGLFTRAFFHVRFCTVNGVPLGIESIAHLFEAPLRHNLKLEAFNLRMSYLDQYVLKFPDVRDVRSLVEEDMPTFLSDDEKKLLRLDLRKATTSRVALEIYLDRFGRDNFERRFGARGSKRIPRWRL